MPLAYGRQSLRDWESHWNKRSSCIEKRAPAKMPGRSALGTIAGQATKPFNH